MRGPASARAVSVLDAVLVSLAIGLSAVLFTRLVRSDESSVTRRKLDGWEEDLRHQRRIGAKEAKFTLVVWTDYQCPACRRFEQEVDTLRAVLGDSIAVVYRYFPLPPHRQAQTDAVIAECARRQGRFESVHSLLIQTDIQDSTHLKTQDLGRRANVPNLADFEVCVQEQQTASIVEADVQRGTAIRIRGTPSLQIGKYISTGGQFADSLLPQLRAAYR